LFGCYAPDDSGAFLIGGFFDLVAWYDGGMKEEKVNYRQVFKMYWPSVRKQWKFIFLFVPLGMVTAGLVVAEPYIYGSVIDSLIFSVQEQLGWEAGFAVLVPFLIAWAGLVVGQTFLGALYRYWVWSVDNEILFGFASDWFRKVMRLDVGRFREEKAGGLLRRFNAAWDASWRVVEFSLSTVLQSVFLFFAGLGMGVFIDWRMTLIALIPLPIVVTIGVFNMMLTEKWQRIVEGYWDKASGLVGDVFININAVKSFVGEGRIAKRYRKIHRHAIDHQLPVNKRWATSEALQGAVYVGGATCGVFGGILFCAWRNAYAGGFDYVLRTFCVY